MNRTKEAPLKFEDLFFATSRQFERIIDQEKEAGKVLQLQIRDAKARHAHDLNEAMGRLKRYADAYDKQKADFLFVKNQFDTVKQILSQSVVRETAQKDQFEALQVESNELTMKLRSQLNDEQQETSRLSLELKENQARLNAQVKFLQQELESSKGQLTRTETNLHELQHYSNGIKMRFEVESKELRNQGLDLQQRLKRTTLEMKTLELKHSQLGEAKTKQDDHSKLLEGKLEHFRRRSEAFQKSEEDRQRLHVALVGVQQRLRDAERSTEDAQDEIHRLKLNLKQLQTLPRVSPPVQAPPQFEEEVLIGYPADQPIYS